MNQYLNEIIAFLVIAGAAVGAVVAIVVSVRRRLRIARSSKRHRLSAAQFPGRTTMTVLPAGTADPETRVAADSGPAAPSNPAPPPPNRDVEAPTFNPAFSKAVPVARPVDPAPLQRAETGPGTAMEESLFDEPAELVSASVMGLFDEFDRRFALIRERIAALGPTIETTPVRGDAGEAAGH